MKYLNGDYYVEVKDHRYRIHPTEIIILRKIDPPLSLGTQYQVQNETQIRKDQKVNKIGSNQLVVKNYPKSKQPFRQPKFKPPNCPACKQNIWLQIDKGWCCKSCEFIINKQKDQTDKKIRRQYHYFSPRINYAYKKLREIWKNMVNTTYISTEDMI